jgi:predicted RNA-binding Zn ribbon-like protein
VLNDPGNRSPAPAPLRLVQVFVNTLDIENGVEELSAPEALRSALPLSAEEPLDEADLAHGLAVREALRALLLANSGAAFAPEARSVLDRAAAAAHLTLELDEAGNARLVPRAGGLDGAIGRLLAVVYGAMADGTWVRLKACPREVCHWVFYDASRNRSGKWCAMSVCGNRTKKARLRAA